VVCRQGKGCDDGGVMVIMVVVWKVMVSLVESTGVRQTPPDSTGLRWTANQAESGGLVYWTGLHRTPPDYSPAVLSGSAMDMAGHSVRQSPTGLCGGEIRTRGMGHYKNHPLHTPFSDHVMVSQNTSKSKRRKRIE